MAFSFVFDCFQLIFHAFYHFQNLSLPKKANLSYGRTKILKLAQKTLNKKNWRAFGSSSFSTSDAESFSASCGQKTSTASDRMKKKSPKNAVFCVFKSFFHR